MSGITTLSARGDLLVRGKPYYHETDIPGFAVGYRKGKHGGAWLARRYIGNGKYESQPFGKAHNSGAPSSTREFDEIEAKAKRWFKSGASRNAPVTLREAVLSFCDLRERLEKSRRGNLPCKNDTRSKMQHVLASPIADKKLVDLTVDDLKVWRALLAKAPSRKGTPMAVASLRRTAMDLSAALNHARTEHGCVLGKHEISEGLAKVVGEVMRNDREPQVLSMQQVGQLVGAARELDAEMGWNGDLHRLILVMAATGMRFSQVQRIKVGHVHAGNRVILVPFSFKGKVERSGKGTAVTVHQSVIEALAPVLDRGANEPLLERPLREKEGMGYTVVGRRAWGRPSDLTNYLWPKILKRAGAASDLIPYCLRHSSICDKLRRHISPAEVAKMHDTSITMLELHYTQYIQTADPNPPSFEEAA